MKTEEDNPYIQIGVGLRHILLQHEGMPPEKVLVAVAADLVADNSDFKLPLLAVIHEPLFKDVVLNAGSGQGGVYRDALLQRLAPIFSSEMVSNISLVLNAILGLDASAKDCDAEPLSSELSNQTGEDAFAYFSSAVEKYWLGDIQGAMDDFSAAIETNPDASLYFTRAQVRHEMGDMQGAVEDYSQVIALRPDDVEATYLRGLVELELGNRQSAVIDFTRILQVYLSNPDAGISGDAKMHFDQGIKQLEAQNLQDAIDEFGRAIESDPAIASAFLCRGLARYGLGDIENFSRDLRSALELDPNLRYITGSMVNLHELSGSEQ